MFFFQVVPDLKLPNIALTYSCENNLAVGQLVEVPIQSREVWGIVIGVANLSTKIDATKIKPVTRVLPYIFEKTWLQFLQLFAQNTFNTLNLSLHSFLQPLKLLTQGDWLQLEQNWDSTENDQVKVDKADSNQTKPTINYHLQTDYILRIIYIIRNIKLNSQILIIFPEKKQLSCIWKEIQNNVEFQQVLKKIPGLTNLIFTGDVSAGSKQTVRIINNLEIIKKTKKNKLSELEVDQIQTSSNSTQIIWATRSGIFLPFSTLTNIILVDEASSFHIQEQNRVYFDTRDAVFLMHMAYSANLDFVSRLPSSRLYNFSATQLLASSMNNVTSIVAKPLTIKITTKNRKFDQFDLFGNQIVGLLKGEQDFVVSDDDESEPE